MITLRHTSLPGSTSGTLALAPAAAVSTGAGRTDAPLSARTDCSAPQPTAPRMENLRLHAWLLARNALYRMLRPDPGAITLAALAAAENEGWPPSTTQPPSRRDPSALARFWGISWPNSDELSLRLDTQKVLGPPWLKGGAKRRWKR